MTPEQTPIAFEDLIEALDSVDKRLRFMRGGSGRDVPSHVLVPLLLTALRDLHALRMDTDKVMAAGQAAAKRAARTMPMPPTVPFAGKESK